MNRVIINVAKALIFTLIFTLVYAFTIYVINLTVLDNRVSAVMASMSNIVSEQNYLPDSSLAYYNSELERIKTDMEGDVDTKTGFVKGWSLNCSNCAKPRAYSGGVSVVGLSVGTNLSVPQNYGSVQVIDIVFEVYFPFIGDLTGTSEMHFTRVVPCQKYLKTN